MHKVVSDDAQEVRLHCFSEERARKERAIVERFATRFEQALTKLCEGLSRPRTEKRASNIRERIGRLKAKSRGIAQHYHIELDTDPTGERARAVRFTRQPVEGSMMTHPGVYCLRSNQTDWDEEALWRTYVTLTDIEAVFRSLKSELGLRPIFHHKPIRAEGHLFITVIAYQLVQVIRRRLRQTRAGTPCAASSKASSASPPPSAAPMGAPCTCERPPVPSRLSRPSTTPWASTPSPEGSERPSCSSPNTRL